MSGEPKEEDDLPVEVEVPLDALSAEARRGVLEEFITREGTDYGHEETSLFDKVKAIEEQVRRGEVVLLFDRRSGTTNLVRREERRGRT